MTAHEARTLPGLPFDPAYTDALQDLATRVNGFVYSGDRLNALVDTVKVLRAHPDLARMLLNPDGDPHA